MQIFWNYSIVNILKRNLYVSGAGSALSYRSKCLLWRVRQKGLISIPERRNTDAGRRQSSCRNANWKFQIKPRGLGTQEDKLLAKRRQTSRRLEKIENAADMSLGPTVYSALSVTRRVSANMASPIQT